MLQNKLLLFCAKGRGLVFQTRHSLKYKLLLRGGASRLRACVCFSRPTFIKINEPYDKFFGGGASELRASDFPDPPFSEIGGGAYFDCAPSI